MSYHNGFLYMSDGYGNPVEVINEERTRRNLSRTMVACGIPFQLNPAYRACAGLAWEPCLSYTPSSPVPSFSWNVMNTAANAAPWFDAADGASSEAIGFQIEEWTGLDGTNVTRQMTSTFPKGGLIGPTGQDARTCAFNVLLLGTTERGLNYLFRWLQTTLMNCCSDCSTSSLWFREYCPADPVADPGDGLARMDRVALLEGPTWADAPVEDAGCYLRRVSFTLGAGDPCFYREPVSLTSASATSVTTSTVAEVAPQGWWIGTAAPVVKQLTPPSYGGTLPLVYISSNEQSGYYTPANMLPDLRVVVLDNPGNLALTRWPEMFVVGGMVLQNIRSGYQVLVDFNKKQVQYRSLSGLLDWQDGSSLVELFLDPFVDGLTYSARRRWPSISNCVNPVVVVEPYAKHCGQMLYNNTTGVLTSVTGATLGSMTWSVHAYQVDTFGCC